MIVDQIAQAGGYRGLGTGIAAALDYLATTDFALVEPGRYELQGDRVFALVQRYVPKPIGEAVWESHRRYIDVQYIAAGRERMGYRPLASAMPVRVAYDEARDVVFYEPGGDYVQFGPGGFAIFTSRDIHAPGVALEGAASGDTVLKVVVKVRATDPTSGF